MSWSNTSRTLPHFLTMLLMLLLLLMLMLLLLLLVILAEEEALSLMFSAKNSHHMMCDYGFTEEHNPFDRLPLGLQVPSPIPASLHAFVLLSPITALLAAPPLPCPQSPPSSLPFHCPSTAWPAR